MSYQYSKSSANPPGDRGRARRRGRAGAGLQLESRAGLTTLANLKGQLPAMLVLQQLTPFLPFFDPGWIDCKCDH